MRFYLTIGNLVVNLPIRSFCAIDVGIQYARHRAVEHLFGDVTRQNPITGCGAERVRRTDNPRQRCFAPYSF